MEEAQPLALLFQLIAKEAEETILEVILTTFQGYYIEVTLKSGVNKNPFVCPFQDRRFQNPDILQTVSEIFTCDRQFWTKQMWKNMC